MEIKDIIEVIWKLAITVMVVGIFGKTNNITATSATWTTVALLGLPIIVFIMHITEKEDTIQEVELEKMK